jgi:hypothetical protein
MHQRICATIPASLPSPKFLFNYGSFFSTNESLFRCFCGGFLSQAPSLNKVLGRSVVAPTFLLQQLSVDELYDASHGKGGANGRDNSLAPPEVWVEAANEELKRRGFIVSPPGIDSPNPTPDPDPVSADAHFIAIMPERTPVA